MGDKLHLVPNLLIKCVVLALALLCAHHNINKNLWYLGRFEEGVTQKTNYQLHTRIANYFGDLGT